MGNNFDLINQMKPKHLNHLAKKHNLVAIFIVTKKILVNHPFWLIYKKQIRNKSGQKND